MALPEPRFTLGIEEEYHLVDIETRDLVRDPPKSVLAEAELALGGHVTTEFLRSQIEVIEVDGMDEASVLAALLRIAERA